MTTPRAYRPQNCPRCDRCSANVCPLDPEWLLRPGASLRSRGASAHGARGSRWP